MPEDEKEDPGVALRRSLGLKPRGERAEKSDKPAAAAAEPRSDSNVAFVVRRKSSSGKKGGEAEPPLLDPRRKPTGKLPPEAQLALRNFYVVRPAIDLPPFLMELQGTMGRYFGDGRPEREILCGWRPEFVLFLLPAYDPDAPPTWEDGALVDPGLHEQPEATDKGYKVAEKWNRPGEAYIFIAWKADPDKKVAEPAATKAPEAGPRPGESQRDYDRRVQREKRDRELAERKAARDARSRSGRNKK
jgi:hypothetical protein